VVAVMELAAIGAGARDRGDAEIEARAANSLSIRRARADDLAGAVELGREAVNRAEAAGNSFLTAQLLFNLAGVYDRAGRTDEALEAFARAAELGRETGAANLELAVEINRGALLNRRHRYEEAIEIFDRSIARAGDLGLPDYAATARINQGAALAQLGEPERARGSYLEALASLAPDDVRDRVIVELNLGDLAFAAHEDDEARRRFESVVATTRGAAGMSDLGHTAEGYLGSLDVREGRVAEGRERLEKLVGDLRESGEAPLLQQTLGDLAEARRRTGDLEAAGAAAEESTALARRMGDFESEAEARGARARVLRDQGHPAAALAEVEAAVATIETIRGALPAAELRASYLSRYRDLYDLGVELSLELDRSEPGAGHAEAAFRWAERARARSLLESLSPIAWAGDAATRELRQRGADVIDARDEWAKHAASADEAGLAAANRLDEAIERYQAARLAWAEAHPLAAKHLERRPASVAEVQAALAPGEALLEYHCGEERCALFVVERARFAARSLGDARPIGAAVADLHSQLLAPSLRDVGRYRDTALRLERLLVAPAGLDAARTKRLLIAPDGPLHGLPFAALVASARGRTWGDLDYLRRAFVISRVPSAAVWLELERRGQTAGAAVPGVFAFGDPELAATGRLAAGGRDAAGDLQPLPGAREEARRAVELTGAGRAWVGAEATEARVKQLSGRAPERLHFATHALVQERRPALSSLVLAPGDGEDGRLEAWEIEGLDLPVRLVVLSACDSALGRPITGEGLVGLVQSFLDAGAASVVATLWAIPDRATGERMADFYRELRDHDAATALDHSQINALAAGGLAAHPSSWAGLVLIGDPGRVP
jgi:CHAT domain-containing protein/Tfp pilus assembly protein PilF